MGLQRLSEKKVKKLSELAGIEFVKAAVRSDGREAEAVTSNDQHFIVDRRTGDMFHLTDCWHWASCERREET